VNRLSVSDHFSEFRHCFHGFVNFGCGFELIFELNIANYPKFRYFALNLCYFSGTRYFVMKVDWLFRSCCFFSLVNIF